MNTVFIEGVGFWSPGLPDWAQAQSALGAAHAAPASTPPITTAPPTTTPPTTLLAGNERRRAPHTVLAALAVAEQAVALSGRPAEALASVFTSTHGDLAIVDALCSTLASDPLLLSPTRFHHSVHNAASGYWAIATGNRHASSAVAHFGHAFAAGLLEACTLCTADEMPVLLVGFDSEARGALASVNASRGLLGLALVLAPERTPQARWQLDWSVAPASQAPAARPRSAMARGATARNATANALAANASADGLVLFEALAHSEPCHLAMPLDRAVALDLRVQPLAGMANPVPPPP